MNKNFVAGAIVISYLLFAGCRQSSAGPVPTPTPVPAPTPDPSIPLQVFAVDPMPPNGTTLNFGDQWRITYSISCNDPRYWWIMHITRDDGAVYTYKNFYEKCKGPEIQWNAAYISTLNKINTIYDFSKGHTIVVRFAVLDAFPNGNIVYIADKELAKWYIAEQ